MTVFGHALIMALVMGLIAGLWTARPWFSRQSARLKERRRTRKRFGEWLDLQRLEDQPQLLERLRGEVTQVGVIENVALGSRSAEGCKTPELRGTSPVARRDFTIFVMDDSDTWDLAVVKERERALHKAGWLAAELGVGLRTAV